MQDAPQPIFDDRPANAPRPGAPKVFGILSIIFGSLMLLGGLMGSCSLAAAGMVESMPEMRGAPPGVDPRVMVEALGSIYTAIGVMSLMIMAMSGWLLGIGIGQVKYRRWAQKQSVIWGIAGLVSVFIFCLFYFLWIGPAYTGMFEAFGDDRAAAAISGAASFFVGTGGAVFTVLFYSPYPILMIIFFKKPRVIEAMAD